MTKPGKDIALCLSGGGTRGAVHLGVLQYLLDHGYRFRAVSGTSIGSLLGGMIAAGHTPEEVLDLMLNEHIMKLFLPVAKIRRGLISHKKIKELLEEMIPHNSFEQLHIPFFSCAVNLQRGEAVYFDHGTLHDKILASISIPLIFSPVNIGGEDYVDGGIRDNLPVRPLVGLGFPIVGVHVNNYIFHRIQTGSEIFRRVMQLLVRQSVDRNKAHCDYFLEPLLEKEYTLFNLKVAGELFDIGYLAAGEYFKKIKTGS